LPACPARWRISSACASAVSSERFASPDCASDPDVRMAGSCDAADGRVVVRPATQAEVDRIVAGFRQECLRVLGETETLRVRLPEPAEGWREYFTRRIYSALLKYKEEVEALVEGHLTEEERARGCARD